MYRSEKVTFCRCMKFNLPYRSENVTFVETFVDVWSGVYIGIQICNVTFVETFVNVWSGVYIGIQI